MTSIALRNLLSHKLRTSLTALAIVLGVMMIAGTYVLSDTIQKSFGQIFDTANAGIDAVVTTHEAVEQQDGTKPPIAASVLSKVKGVPGVAEADGAINDQQVVIIDKDGKRVGHGGAPSIGVSATTPRFDPLTYVEGRHVEHDDEVVIDKQSADDAGYKLGDQVKIEGKTAAKDYTLVGIAKLGDVDSFGGASLAELTLPEAQRVTGKEGQFDQIEVAASDGTSPEQLASNLKAALGHGVDVKTGQQNAQSQANDVQSFIDILKTILLVFAGIALFVASFLIFNTFSITIAQRTREFAMLRTIGANRCQILVSVISEALVIGILASLIGLGLGILFAPAVGALFAAVGIDLPRNGTVIEARTIIVALGVGTGLTLFSALFPAIRATRVPPVAGLREGAVLSTTGERRRRTAAGAVIASLGIVAIVLGLAGSGLAWVGGGAGATFLGVALFSPRLVPAMAALVGAPLERVRGISGRLARENAVRNPGRTATTAAALMIGIALVAFVTIIASGLKGGIDKTIDKTISADLIVGNSDGFSDIPYAIQPAVAATPGVEVASPLRFAQDKVAGAGKGSVTIVHPQTATDVMNIQWEHGDQATLRDMQPNQVVADKNWAKGNGYGIGDTFRATTASGKVLPLTVVGTFTDDSDFFGDYIASDADAEAFGEGTDITNVFAKLQGGANGPARATIDKELTAGFPTAKTQTRDELKKDISGKLNQLLGVIYALLALAVIVSLFGIVNTLALSIYERTRELGLLRAVGMSRRQVRRVIRYEAVITAMIGAVLGLALGVVFAVLVSRELNDDGFTLKIPVGTLIFLLVLATIAGILAAILPARRASRLDVLEALAYE